MIENKHDKSKSLWEKFNSLNGIIGTTAGLISIWLFGWQVWGWWFFGLDYKI
jgi:hypothetical protein